MVARPSPWAWRRPAALTDATSGALEIQATGRPLIIAPAASRISICSTPLLPALSVAGPIMRAMATTGADAGVGAESGDSLGGAVRVGAGAGAAGAVGRELTGAVEALDSTGATAAASGGAGTVTESTGWLVGVLRRPRKMPPATATARQHTRHSGSAAC
jgi:hypothetical protein